MISTYRKNTPKIAVAMLVLALLLLGVFMTRQHPAIPLTTEEQAWLKAHEGKINLAPCPGWEPMEFFDDTAGYHGMVADYIRLIEKKLDFRFNIVLYDSWAEILAQARKGKVDVISAAHATPERWEFMNWTDPYLEFPAVIITRKSDKGDLVPEMMAGMKVGVCKEYVVSSYLKTTYPDLDLHPFDLGIEGLEKVSFGELDAMIMELPNAFYNIEKNKITNLRMAGKTEWVARYGIGTRKTIPELHSIMQKALTMISLSEKRNIHRRWIGLEQSILLYKRSIWYGIIALCAGVFVIIAVVLIWNFTLKQRIDEATRELQEELEERMRAESRSRKLEDQLRQAHKMEAIGTLAGGIAHDFNNILGTIIGYAEMIELFDAPDDGRMRERLEQVLTASYRAKDLVNQILTFSRQSDQEKRPVSLAPVIKETSKFIQVLLPPGVMVETSIKDQDLIVLASPVQIHQIIMNLCTNGAHAIGEENTGVIHISLERKQMDPHRASQYLGIGPGTYAWLTVSDTGEGMSPDILDRVFDPFFTTKPAGKGTGMGLPVVHGIVKSCSGHIRVKSKKRKGTTIEILIPESEKKDDQAREASDLRDISGPGGRIMIVDDEPALLSMGRDLLIELGYDVIAESDAQAALERFKESPYDIDLILTDLIMPDFPGDRLAWRMKLVRPEIPVILCSGRIGQERAENAIRRFGIDAFLKKPLGIKELANAVKAYMPPVSDRAEPGSSPMTR